MMILNLAYQKNFCVIKNLYFSKVSLHDSCFKSLSMLLIYGNSTDPIILEKTYSNSHKYIPF